MIYRDKPLVVFMRTDDNRVRKHKSVRNLVENHLLKFGWKETFSYGKEFDDMLKESRTPVVTHPATMPA